LRIGRALAVGLPIGLPILALMVVLSAVIGAAILHVCLLIVGGARQPYETTLRLICYAMGSTAMFSLVPIVGGLVGAIYQIVVVTVGCWCGHETTLGRAVGAVLIQFALGCLAGTAIFFMFFASLLW
jgi:hypothetical protein